MDDDQKRRRLFEEDRGGLAFREIFTPTREGPLPKRSHPRPSGKGGPSVNPTPPPAVTSVWSAADATANGMVLSNGGSTVTVTNTALGNVWQILRGTVSKTSGKLYIEYSTSTGMVTTFHAGLASAGVNINSYLGDSNYSAGMNPIAGAVFVSAGFTSGGPFTNLGNFISGDVMALAVDLTIGNVWLAKNNVWFGSGVPGEEINLLDGENPIVTFIPATVGALFPSMAFSTAGSSGVWTLQSTAASQKYTPPAGYSAWG
jgi:hypothetical protein